MLDFKIIKDAHQQAKWLETSLSGAALLTISQLNKGTAFTDEERCNFGLLGKLPSHVETLEEQVKRCYGQYQLYDTKLQKNIYLNNLLSKNQVLFYKLVHDHMAEMMPLIYTPVVGTAVEEFSKEFRQPRGLYIPYTRQNEISRILKNRSNPEIDIVVVTDGEGVLGIGDQGSNAMNIPIAKLMLYTLCAGVDPLRTLPIQLDVGTNSQKLLEDPFYLGWRHARIEGEAYDDFVEQFVSAVQQEFPHVFLHWEDLGRSNAGRILEMYKDRLCTFNDDIQGTGTVTLAAILAAVRATGTALKDHRIVIFGAGTAGIGIAQEIFQALQREGVPEKEARNHLWLVDRQGLLIQGMMDLTKGQHFFACSASGVCHWQRNEVGIITLPEVIKQVKPTILIGCSSSFSAFHRVIIEQMVAATPRPIIFPLSNPTEHCEATPADILTWTNGSALIATGSPFEPVIFKGQQFPIAQCNNALAFPGIGLGILATRPKKLSPSMLWAACQVLCLAAPILKDPQGALLPRVENSWEIAKTVAFAVAQCAIGEGLAQIDLDGVDLMDHIEQLMWVPHYLPYRVRTQ